MSEKITADPALREKLKTANGLGIPLYDTDGKTIGIALSVEQFQRYMIELEKARYSQEDLDRIASKPGAITTEELFERLGLS